MSNYWDALPPGVRRWSPLLLLMLLYAGLPFVAKINHDESQYVAATWLMRSGLPYRDFAYLQTPLQPMLLSPLSYATNSYLLLASRLANALFAVAGIAFLWAALRASGVGGRAATIACALMASCAPLLFAASVARNDALPFMMFAAALWQLAERPSFGRVMLIGFLMSAATAAKISYAIPSVALGLLSALGPRSVRDRLLLKPLVLGAASPAIIVVGLASLAPSAFMFEVVDYAVEAPRQWYQLIGQADRLTTTMRIADFLRFGIKGPAVVALVCLAVAAWSIDMRTFFRGPRRLIILVLLLASIIAAIMPSPMQKQYWLPALPPLFLCLGIAIDKGLRWPRPTALLLAASAVAGWVPMADDTADAVAKAESPAVEAGESSKAIGAAMDRYRLDGPVVTLRPDLFVQTDEQLDPRFAAGPFLYRSTGLINMREARQWRVLGGDQSMLLHNSPPAAFVLADPATLWSGDDVLARRLAATAYAAGFRPVARHDELTLWLPLKYSPAR